MTKQRTKICFVNTCKVWGGGELWHYQSMVSLVELGYEVSAIAYKNSPLAEKIAKHQAIKLFQIRTSSISFLNPLKIMQVLNILSRNKPDVILLNLPIDVKLVGTLAKSIGIKKIIYRRGSAIPLKNSISNRFLFKYIVNTIIANSEATKRTILEKNKTLFSLDKIVVIYNSVTIPINSIKKEYIQGQPIIIGNAGRLVYQKGQEYLIELSNELKILGIKHEIIIAGEGDRYVELLQLAKDYGVLDSIKFVGFTSDITHFLNQIDVFVLTSRWEGFGYVIAEANASLKPVIAFDVSSNPELICSNYNGYLAKPFNVKQIADHISSLVKDPDMIIKMGTNGREYVKKHFDKEKILKQLQEVIDY